MENENGFHYNNLAPTISETCGTSRRQTFNKKEEPAPLLNRGRKYI